MKLKQVYDKQDWEKCQSQRALSVIDIIGNIEPKNVNDEHIEKVRNRLEKKGLSGATINRYLASLSKLLKYAHKRYTIFNMERMPHIEWYKESKGRIRYISKEEEAKIIELLKDSEYLSLYLFLMDTGMRLSEALSFTKEDIQELGDKTYITLYGTKNGDTRSVPLTDRAKKLSVNTFQHLDYWKAENTWKQLRKNMGLANDKQFVIHSLRHTCASRLAQSGKIELHIIKELLGHRSYNTTLRYSHFKPSNLLGAVDILNNLD
tara:strand:- start:414 stop:1202 length:789 start_codon:yes stop_codon:yes gene_type:complete